MYLYGIDAISIEEMKWEILFELFVQRLYRPTETVNLGNILYRELKVVSQQHGRFLLLVKDFHSSCLMSQFASGEQHRLVYMGHKAVWIDVSG